jgi:hypothetical protein
MEGLRDPGVLLFTSNASLVQQKADTSLSCHQNNTDSKRGTYDSGAAADVEENNIGNQHPPV